MKPTQDVAGTLICDGAETKYCQECGVCPQDFRQYYQPMTLPLSALVTGPSGWSPPTEEETEPLRGEVTGRGLLVLGTGQTGGLPIVTHSPASGQCEGPQGMSLCGGSTVTQTQGTPTAPQGVTLKPLDTSTPG